MRLSKATLRSPALYNSCRLLSFFLIYDFCFSLYLPSFRETARRQCLFDAYVVTRVYADFRKHNYRLHIQPSRRDVKYGKTQLITHVASFSTHHISPSLSLSLSLSLSHTHTHTHSHACVRCQNLSLYTSLHSHTHTRAPVHPLPLLSSDMVPPPGRIISPFTPPTAGPALDTKRSACLRHAAPRHPLALPQSLHRSREGPRRRTALRPLGCCR